MNRIPNSGDMGIIGGADLSTGELIFVSGFGILMLIYLVLIGIAIANYVLQAFALMRIANRRGIKNGWLAWLPYGNAWVIGSIADHYDGTRGIKRKLRWVILISLLLASALIFVGYIGMMVTVISANVIGGNQEIMYPEMPMQAAISAIIFYIVLIIGIIASMIPSMLQYIAIYKIFESTAPARTVLLFVLSALVPLAQGICLMCVREKGYPFPVETPEEPVPTVPASDEASDNMGISE